MSLELPKLGTPKELGTTAWPAWLKEVEIILRERHPCIGNALSSRNLGLELIIAEELPVPARETEAQRSYRLAIDAREEKRAYIQNKEKKDAAKRFYATMLRACSEELLEEVRSSGEFEVMNQNQELLTLKRVLEIASCCQKGASDEDILDAAEREWSSSQ